MQIVACASHWTHGMEVLTSNAMKNPSVFVSSCMEAAVYGKMKLDVRLGTAKEMDCLLLQIVREKLSTRTIIFCRGATEVSKVADMISTVLSLTLFSNFVLMLYILIIIIDWRDTSLGSRSIICDRIGHADTQVECCSFRLRHFNLYRRCLSAVRHKKCADAHSLLHTTPFQIRL